MSLCLLSCLLARSWMLKAVWNILKLWESFKLGVWLLGVERNSEAAVIKCLLHPVGLRHA